MFEWPARFFERLFTLSLQDLIHLFIGIVLLAGVVGFALASNPHVDAQYRFVLREGLDAFGDNESADLTFTGKQSEMINSVSSTSYGPDPVGDERLFCMKVDDGVVTELRFADNISESTQTSISGSCTNLYSSNEFDGFLHTQPSYSDELSDEDKDLESSIDYTCIAFDSIVKVGGEVGGLKCWEVTDSKDSGYGFEEIEVGITSRPDLVPT